MQSSELPEDEREGVNQETYAEESRPPDDFEAAAARDEVAVPTGESAELSDSIGDPSDSTESDTPEAVASTTEFPVDGANASRDLISNQAGRSSSPDEAVAIARRWLVWKGLLQRAGEAALNHHGSQGFHSGRRGGYDHCGK